MKTSNFVSTKNINNILYSIKDSQNRNDPNMYVSTGMYCFDKLTGRPGMLKGHYLSILGYSQSFKSYVTGEMIKNCINYNLENFNDPGIHFLKDSENSYSPDFLIKRDIDPSLIHSIKARTIFDVDMVLTQLFNEYRKYLNPKIKKWTETDIFNKTPVNTVIIDTVSSLPTEMDMENKKMHNAAIEMSTLLRNHQQNVYDLNFIMILVYQEKDDRKVTPYSPTDWDKKARGFRPARFHSEIVYHMQRKKRYENSVTFTIDTKVKNRLREGFDNKVVETEMVYNFGINDTIEILNSALEMGLTTKKRGGYEVNGKILEADDAAKALMNDVFKNEYAFMGFTDYTPYKYKEALISKGVENEEIPVELLEEDNDKESYNEEDEEEDVEDE